MNFPRTSSAGKGIWGGAIVQLRNAMGQRGEVKRTAVGEHRLRLMYSQRNGGTPAWKKWEGTTPGTITREQMRAFVGIDNPSKGPEARVHALVDLVDAGVHPAEVAHLTTAANLGDSLGLFEALKSHHEARFASFVAGHTVELTSLPPGLEALKGDKFKFTHLYDSAAGQTFNMIWRTRNGVTEEVQGRYGPFHVSEGPSDSPALYNAALAVQLRNGATFPDNRIAIMTDEKKYSSLHLTGPNQVTLFEGGRPFPYELGYLMSSDNRNYPNLSVLSAALVEQQHSVLRNAHDLGQG